jgi:hypothetical protein
LLDFPGVTLQVCKVSFLLCVCVCVCDVCALWVWPEPQIGTVSIRSICEEFQSFCTYNVHRSLVTSSVLPCSIKVLAGDVSCHTACGVSCPAACWLQLGVCVCVCVCLCVCVCVCVCECTRVRACVTL